MEYSVDYKVTGRDIDAIIAAGGRECLTSFPSDHWMLDAIGDLPQEPDTADTDLVGVPAWAMHLCFERAFDIGDSALRALYGAGTVVHAQTLVFLKDAAFAAGFHLKQNGEARYWPTMATFAHDLGIFAGACRAGPDPSPALVYDEDAVRFVVHAQTLAFLKDAAFAAGFHLKRNGEARYWPTMAIFAHDVGIFADACRAGPDPSPALLYDEDAVRLANPNAFPAQYACLNNPVMPVRYAGICGAQGLRQHNAHLCALPTGSRRELQDTTRPYLGPLGALSRERYGAW